MEERNETAINEAEEATPLLPTLQVTNRDQSLDYFRGIIMVLESLDHSRDFISNIVIEHEQWNILPSYIHPTLSREAVWFLRMITGFCAPGFLFLMGLGMCYFVNARKRIGWTAYQIQRHFLVRGLLLIFLNFTHFPPMLFWFGFAPILTVLFALGIDMILGALILQFELWISEKLTSHWQKCFSCSFYSSITFSIVVLVTVYSNHVSPTEKQFSSWLLISILPFTKLDHSIMSIYPFLPWLAPVGWGLLFGRVFVSLSRNSKIVLHASSSFVFLFFFLLLRWNGGFGNVHLELLKPPLNKDFVSFMTLVKYPPSLTYMCWTMGINHMLICLCVLLPKIPKWDPFLVFGKSALFFYIAHFWIYYLIKLFIVMVFRVEQVEPLWFFIAWIFGLAILHPLCSYYGMYKNTKAPNSVWRLF
jgi:uncharacterized membrane protein